MKKTLNLVCCLFVVMQLSAQVAPVDCPYSCAAKPISSYNVGMRFYFPVDKAALALNKPLPRFSIRNNCDPPDIDYRPVKYEDVAGKIFVIDSISVDPIRAYGENNFKLYEFYLRGDSCKDFIFYQRQVDMRQLDAKFGKQDSLIPEGYTIDDALSLDEVDAGRAGLVGNYYYLLSPDEQKNGQQVKIINVQRGKFHAPLLVYYQFSDKSIDSVYTDVCHLNAPLEGRSNVAFSRYFSCKTPPSAPVINPGMTPVQVEAIFGKPLKKTQTRTAASTILEYTYKDQVLTFDNGVLQKIVSTQ